MNDILNITSENEEMIEDENENSQINENSFFVT